MVETRSMKKTAMDYPSIGTCRPTETSPNETPRLLKTPTHGPVKTCPGFLQLPVEIFLMIVNFMLESRSTCREYEAQNWTNLLNLSYTFPGFKTTLWDENLLALWFPPRFKSVLGSEVGHLKYTEIDLSDLNARNQWLEAWRLFSTAEEVCLKGDSKQHRPLPPVRVKELGSWKDCATFEKAKRLVLAPSLTFDVAALRLFQNLNLENVTSLVFHARIYGKYCYHVNLGEDWFGDLKVKGKVGSIPLLPNL